MGVKISKIIYLIIGFLIIWSSFVLGADSYIIVHAVNPEGVEIASIEGMDSYCVEIYDGDILIGYGAHNNETHNKPITISPGTHIIKAKFNGMIKEQTISLISNETKMVAFTFERLEFDLFSAITSSWIVNIEDSFEKVFSEGVSYYNQIKHPLYTGYYSTVCRAIIRGEGSINLGAKLQFNSDGSWYLYTKWVGNSNGWVDGDANCNLNEDFNSYTPINISASGSFDRWFIQCQQIKEPNYITYPSGYRIPNGVWAQTMPDKQFLFSTDDYSINSIIANSQISYIHFRIPTFGSGYLFQGERSLTGKILSLKMSSVPYDLLGTGMKDGENLPPVASFTYSPQNPFANEEIIFDGSSSHDPDGQITQYKWNFGDGNSTEGIKLSHTYNKTRNYTVTLTVTDNDGLEDSLSKNIEVIKPPILLVYGWHGTVQNWDLIKQWLEKDGYIVEILEYDDSQHATIAAGTLSQKVNEMLVKYNTHKIDIIAHSFGGLVSRYYIEKMGGDEKVKNLVMIATPNHGSRLADYVTGEIDDNLGKNIAQFSLWLYALVRADKKWGSSLDLRTLNNNLFDLLNIGFDPNKLDTNYFVIAGTGHYPTKLSSHKMFLPGHDDGVVAVDSASLKTHGIPLYCTELDHSSIVNPYRVLERNYSDQLSRERLLKEVYNNVIKPILDGYSPPTSISPCPTTQDADDNQFLPNILDHIFIRLVPSESKDGNFDVSSSSSDIEIGITFHWCDFNFSLTSPTGREITPDIASKDENVEYFNNNSYWYYLIKNPEEGEWQYHIKAIEVPEEGTDIGISFIEYNFHFFNISLVKGWNLISIPLNLSNNSIKYIFNNTNLTIYSYKNNSFFVPKEINNELGYWIKVNTTSKLSLEGSSFKNAEINLSRGWNLIGYPSLDIKNVSAVFDNVSVVYAYNGTWRSYILNKTFNSLQTLKPGYGYWVKK